ncbi:MAG: GNAT family N-acetyltransferase [Chloroflexota bacterium]
MSELDFVIRPFTLDDMDAVVELSLLAWEPVFVSFRRHLGDNIFSILYPDWRKSQAEVVTEYCMDKDNHTTLVADVAGQVAGFLLYKLDEKSKTGEIYLLAVHPDHQSKNIGTHLNKTAIEAFREAGMTMAFVSTGGDEGHAPARRSYEKAGFTPLPQVLYFKDL